jgi:hypothetical protein
MALIYVPGQGLVGVGEVRAGGRDLVELLAVARYGVGQVDDVEDLGTAEAGDLDGTHGTEARARHLRPGGRADDSARVD